MAEPRDVTPTDPAALAALPCPFCGSTNLSIGTIMVACNDCEATGPVEGPDGPQASVAAWNTHAAAALERPEGRTLWSREYVETLLDVAAVRHEWPGATWSIVKAQLLALHDATAPRSGDTPTRPAAPRKEEGHD